MDKKIVLSLDGGGVKGLTSIFILSYIEKIIKQKINKQNFKIGEVFDFVSGTSTGSIIGSLLIFPNYDNNLKYSAKDILELYINLSTKIFKRSWKYKIQSLWGLNKPIYSVKNLEKILEEIYNDLKLKDLKKPCLFPAYDINKRRIKIFTNQDPIRKYENYLIKDVIRGSTSIPGFFKPQYFFQQGIENTLIDGGVFANNPSLSAYIEVSKTEFDNKIAIFNPNDLLFISIGTGDTYDKSYKYKNVKNRGIIWWFKPVLDILTASSAELIDYEMYKLFSAYNQEKHYYRLNPKIKNANSSALDASKENISDLLLDAERYIKKNKDKLNKLIENIIKIKKLKENV